MGNAQSEPINVVLATTELLGSGEYSDMTLVCDGQHFHLHKGIICTQSPVIAADMKSNFKEAEANIMEIDFDLTTLECMLWYMYTGDYKEQSAEHVRILQLARSAQSVQPNSADGGEQHVQSTQGTECEEKLTATTISETLIYHARVNRIANCYGVTGLAKISADRIMTVLNESWSMDAFCDLIEEVEVTFSSRDNNLRKVIVHAAAANVSELLSKDLFSKGKIANHIAAEVLKLSAQNLQNLQNQVKAGKERINSLEENLNEIATVLSKRKCHEWTCPKEYGCRISRPSENTADLWLVCCNQCGRSDMYKNKDYTIFEAEPSPTN
ncbi:hypothetical protein F4679DRAFT_579578 [Xylaria curta]|nr:hypothetical protein F4679DRAFT_579578 [Xylaria curta]